MTHEQLLGCGLDEIYLLIEVKKNEKPERLLPPVNHSL